MPLTSWIRSALRSSSGASSQGRKRLSRLNRMCQAATDYGKSIRTSLKRTQSALFCESAIQIFLLAFSGSPTPSWVSTPPSSDMSGSSLVSSGILGLPAYRTKTLTRQIGVSTYLAITRRLDLFALSL